MVKGITKQVIVLHPQDQKLFDQAIFILRDDLGEGISEDALLQEANAAIRSSPRTNHTLFSCGPVWACIGAMVTGIAWLLTAF